MHSLVIATRKSRLALRQAEQVRTLLMELHPASEISLLGLSTRGDRILDRPLADIGGKGLFIKELEQAMLAGHADLAVHSLKDVPMEMPEGFRLAAILKREEAFDAWVSNRHAGPEDLPAGAIIGTSSVRREALLRTLCPQAAVRGLRGNLDTRLSRLDAGEYDAIVLAAAGLVRLGLTSRIRCRLDDGSFLPAPGQGALGIEIRSDNHRLAEWLQPLNDPETGICVAAERAFSRTLGGSCHTPLGAHAVLTGSGTLHLRGFVGGLGDQPMRRGEITGSVADAEALGRELATRLS